MKITILSKQNFEKVMRENEINDDTVKDFKNTFFISICNSEKLDWDTRSWFDENHENVIRLFFDDITPRELGAAKHVATLFDSVQAEELVDFCAKIKENDEVFVHCSAGISRSTAVGTYIGRKFGITEDPTRFIHGKHFFPNDHVLKLLYEAEGSLK